ncbi:MAG: hypothetical protein AAFV46_10320, partial [Cyanobacteria bacterium J06635_11]
CGVPAAKTFPQGVSMMTPSPPQTLHQRVSALSAQQKLALARELSLAQPQSLEQQPQAKASFCCAESALTL